MKPQARPIPEEFVAKLGLPTLAPGKPFMPFVRKRHGKSYASQLRQLFSEPDSPDVIEARYRLIFESVDTAKTFQLTVLNPATVDCLHWWNTLDLPEGDILDFGCGCGIASCYFATIFPNRRVIGIDLDARAIECARELAESLKLANVTFHASDINQFDADTTFSNINSFYSLVAATDISVPDIGGFCYLPQVRNLLAESTISTASMIASHLSPDGLYSGVERIPSALVMAKLMGGFSSESMQLNAGSIRKVHAEHAIFGPESTIAAGFSKKGSQPLTADSLISLIAANFSDLQAEIEASRLSNVRFRRGVELAWPQGERPIQPKAHHYDFVAGGMRFYYHTTTLGYRELVRQTSAGDGIDNPDFDEVLDRAARRPEGEYEVRPLTFRDMETDLNASSHEATQTKPD